jgi:hypothetical protein
LKHSELVIAVDTSLAHLAGALAVPAWIAMPLAPDWRWLLEREDAPWYPTFRLFRQTKLGDWPHVIERMADALRDQFAQSHPSPISHPHHLELNPPIRPAI